MRRNDRAINIEEARNLLESAEYGVLSMACPDGVPYGIPLNFALAGDDIYFHCAPEGRKIEILTANTRVSFCVVGRTKMLPEKFGTKYESASASGFVEELFAEEKKQGLVLLLEKYSPGYLKEGLEYVDAFIDKTKVFRIRVESITGKARK
ncbi:MAG: pyridoxamine 5'-phosphate oxidase family protein [bacterium]